MIDKFGRSLTGTVSKNTGVTKSYIKTNYIESNIEEDIDMKNTFKIKNLPNPTLPQDPATKIYVDNEINNDTIVRTNKNNDSNGNRITGCESIYVERDPIYDLELTPKRYVTTLVEEGTIARINRDNNFQGVVSLNVDTTKKFDDYAIGNVIPKYTIDEFVSTNIDEFSLLRLHPDEKLNTNVQDFITFESNLTTPKTIVNVPLNKNLVRSDGDIDFNNHSLTNVSDPINDNDVTNKKYVDSKFANDAVQQDDLTVLTSSSNIIALLLDTLDGLISFKIATKEYVDLKFAKPNSIFINFTNNSGSDLWPGFVLEVAAGMTDITGFFKSSNTTTSSSGTGPTISPPIGDYYAFIEASNPNNGAGKYGIATYTQFENIQRIKFWYHRSGSAMCRFRLQFLSATDEWIDQVVLESQNQLSEDWVLLEETFSDYNKGIRFYFDEIGGFESDMAISDIEMELLSA